MTQDTLHAAGETIYLHLTHFHTCLPFSLDSAMYKQ